MQNKTSPEAEKFWKEYEEKTGEKVYAYSLGRYLEGWDEFPGPLWGLLIVTQGGFRFHHFPQEGWLSGLSRLTTGGGKEPPSEKTFFIPWEHIISAELKTEKSWLKRIFFSSLPRFILFYRDDGGGEHILAAETDKRCLPVVEALNRQKESLKN